LTNGCASACPSSGARLPRARSRSGAGDGGRQGRWSTATVSDSDGERRRRTAGVECRRVVHPSSGVAMLSSLRRELALAVVIATCVAPAASAQAAPAGAADSAVRVTLKDGSVIYGTLLRRDADSVVVQGDAGRYAVAASFVADVRRAGAARVGADGHREYWPPNANATRMFFGP